MNILSRLVGVALATVLAGSAVALCEDEKLGPKSNPMIIQRSHSLYSEGIPAEGLQRMAQGLGCGTYYFRAAFIPETEVIRGAPRVLFVFHSIQALRHHLPERRFLYQGITSAEIVAAASDGDLLAAYFRTRRPDELGERKMAERLPAVLSAVLYECHAKLLKSENRKLDDRELNLMRYCGQGLCDELRALSVEPVLSRSQSNEFVWKGRFILHSGAVEEVTAEIPGSGAGNTTVNRVVLKNIGYFPEINVTGAAAERWDVGPTRKTPSAEIAPPSTKP